MINMENDYKAIHLDFHTLLDPFDIIPIYLGLELRMMESIRISWICLQSSPWARIHIHRIRILIKYK